jgi:hypothetical protein
MMLVVGPTAVALAAPNKKILVALDGTGDNARDFAPVEGEDQNIANPLKMILLAGGDIDNVVNTVDGQVCLYVRGVGGVTDNPILKKLRFGLGNLDLQTKPAKKLLAEIYEEGDKLYLVGFSRGSGACRKLACELEKEGLTTAGGKLIEKPPIEFLGCFDTVPMQFQKYPLRNALRIIRNSLTKSQVLGEKGGKIPSIVKRAVHCMSLDDNRNTMYRPCHMDSADERVVEAWFPGEHGDTGGTYFQKGLPDGPFRYMQEWMESLDEPLTFISNTKIDDECLDYMNDGKKMVLDKRYLDVNPNPSDPWHLKGKQITEPEPRPVGWVTNQKFVDGKTVKIHESVLDHMEATMADDARENYAPNPNLKETDFVVVGSLGKTLEGKTKRLKELLEQQA